MNRYLLFAGETYHPLGGWNDFIGDFDQIDEALEKLVFMDLIDWWHILDTKHWEIVKRGRK